MTKLKRLVGGYYGTRNAEFFPQLFVDRARKGTAFVDITAGTGQFPYRMAAEYEVPVLLCERCPYVGYLLRSVFEGAIQNSASARNGKLPQGRMIGYLSKREDLVGTIFSSDMAQRIDHLAWYAREYQDEALLHCLGRALNNTFTYRSMNWSKSIAKGKPSTSVSVAEIEGKILRALAEVAEYHRAISHGVIAKSAVFLGDSVKLVPRIGESGALRGAVVYADPAWPWSQGSAAKDNPYAFHYEELSSILEQKQLKLDTIWSRSDPDRIRKEVVGWVRDAFKHDARQFIACTQDTNFPHPNAVRQWFVDEGFKIPHTMMLHDRSASADREYLNFWFFLEP